MDSLGLKTLEILLCDIFIALSKACSVICELISLFLHPVSILPLEKEEETRHLEKEEVDLL